MSKEFDRIWKELEEQAEKKAKELTPIPKELNWFSKFNTLKSAVLKKIKNDYDSIDEEDRDKLTIFEENGKFGFYEKLVNVMMHYAYEEGKKSLREDFERRTRHMDEGLKKIADVLEGLGYVNEEEY